jgi:predicted PurR-regulated permease PerM
MAGAKLMGLAGALLAIPVVISVMVLAQEFLAAKGDQTVPEG